MEVSAFVIIVIVFWLAGLIKGISGLGLATIVVGMLSLFMPPAKAAMLMVAPSLVTNLAQCVGQHTMLLIRRFWALWLTLGLTTAFAPFPGLNAADTTVSTIMLGLVLIVYGAWGLRKPTLPTLKGPPSLISALAGLLTGLVTATTGVFVLPLVPYLQTLRLSKDQFIQTLGISFTVATIGLGIRLGSSASLAWQSHVADALLGVIAALIGLWMGARIRHRLNPAQFQSSLYAVFALLGVIMIARSFY